MSDAEDSEDSDATMPCPDCMERNAADMEYIEHLPYYSFLPEWRKRLKILREELSEANDRKDVELIRTLNANIASVRATIKQMQVDQKKDLEEFNQKQKAREAAQKAREAAQRAAAGPHGTSTIDHRKNLEDPEWVAERAAEDRKVAEQSAASKK